MHSTTGNSTAPGVPAAPSPAAGPGLGSRRMLTASVVVGLGLLGAFVVAMDGEKTLRVVRGVDWSALPVAAGFTALSYFCLTKGYDAINRIFGIRLRRLDQLEVGFVSFALNNLLSGGVAGYSLRLLLLRRRGFATADILGASLVHSYFNHLVMMALLPAGLLYLLIRHPLGHTRTFELVVATLLAVGLLGLTTTLLLHGPSRSRAGGVVVRLVRAVTRRDIRHSIRNLDDTLGRGTGIIRRRPAVLLWPFVLVLADWAASVAALGWCFRALGSPLHTGVLLTGFAIGVTLGMLSMLPGGMGVQEGSMTGVYVLLGVDFEHAVLASVLFRAVYYLVPFAVSLLLYARLLRDPLKTAPIPLEPS